MLLKGQLGLLLWGFWGAARVYYVGTNVREVVLTLALVLLSSSSVVVTVVILYE